jgi:hypothetical protein
MKYQLLTAIVIFCFVTCAIAQHPLHGTWQLISAKRMHPDGNRMSMDTSQVREMLIITPTHYMLLFENVNGDSLRFGGAHGGRIKIEGNKCYQFPDLVSNEAWKDTKTDFNWKTEGDRFTLSGTAAFPNGQTIIVEEVIYKRVPADHAYPENPAVGTWEQLSSQYMSNNQKGTHTNATATRYHIITPTHWMRISHSGNKFENAMYGTYTWNKDKGDLVFDRASFPIPKKMRTTYQQRFEGDKLLFSGNMTSEQGTLSWDDVFIKVDPQQRLDKVTAQ